MNGSLYWITESLPGLLWFAVIYAALGVPAALVALPQRNWSDRAAVGALAMAFAPALLTAWLFILGSLGAALNTALMRPAPLLAGCAVIATVLWGGVSWKRAKGQTIFDERTGQALSLQPSDKILFGVLLLLLSLAVFLRWVTTAYWPFTAYDTLWVYGYQGRLYALNGLIPTTIGYYPPFMSLQYASAQILFGINDHAARMTIPFLHIGGILAAYLLGQKLFDRRTGWALAALWGLYPHVGAWAHIGDLEIPLAFLFTLAAAFFLEAWRDAAETTNRRAALIAGAALGIALWTKPTAGAFVWGVALLVGVELIRAIFKATHRPVFLRRFMTAFYTGMACVPLGGAWYVRNILLGHDPVDFPPASWLTKATRSGDLLGWLLLALIVLLVASLLWRRPPRETLILGIGTALITLGAVPSMPWYAPARLDPPMSYITLGEGLLIGAGVVLLAGLMMYRWTYLAPHARQAWATIGAAMLLALPYFITWFFSYSYHYRLSFAIVPLLMLPLAVLIEQLWSTQWQAKNEGLARQPPTGWKTILAAIVVIVMAVPGITATITEAARQDDWLWEDRYPDDTARYKEHAPDMMLLRDTLEAYKRDNGKTPVIVAPGEQRLPFFYPELTIVTDTLPTRLEELEDFTHYIYGTQPEWRYQDESIPPDENQIVASLGRKDVMLQTMSYNDGIFRYEVYEPHLEARKTLAMDYLAPVSEEVVYGSTVQWTDYIFSSSEFGNSIFYDLAFRAVAQPTVDLTLSLALVHVETGEEVYRTTTCFAPGQYGCYRAVLWDEGEIVTTSGKLIGASETQGFPPGDYVLRVGVYEGSGRPWPVVVDGDSRPYYDLAGFRK